MNAEKTDCEWMEHALVLAQRAEAEGEVPVGAVLVQDGVCVGEGWNRPIASRDPSSHAEICALRAAAQTLENYRLLGTTLYVTLEPCTMCVGAILHARIGRLVYGASDPKAGAVESMLYLLDEKRFNHDIPYQGGVKARECGLILTQFFQARR